MLRRTSSLVWASCLLLVAASSVEVCAQDQKALAKEILKSAGVRPGAGFCVHLDVGDGKLMAELAIEGKLLVHGLSPDRAVVAKARKDFQSKGLYGQITVEHWTSKSLPYADNLVNLLIVDGTMGISKEEVLRVLCPKGTAIEIKGGGKYKKLVKPRPAGMDEWTHPRYAAHGNQVSKDTLEPVTGFRWIAGPTWPRAPRKRSLRAFVSANGRNFYLTSNAHSNLNLPSAKVAWRLVGRDAYNGLLLWSRPWDGIMPIGTTRYGYSKELPIAKRLWHKPVRPGEGGRIPYPLVAVGDLVYTAEGKKVAVLDAATGKTVRLTEELECFPEFLVCQGKDLVVLTQKQVYSIDPASGKVRWKFPAEAIDLVIGGNSVFFMDTAKKQDGANKAPDTATDIDFGEMYDLVCLDLREGTEVWRKSIGNFWLPPRSKRARGVYVSSKKSTHKKQLVALRLYKDGRLFLADLGTIYAVSAKDGSHLWTYDKVPVIGKLLLHSVFYAAGAIWPMNGGTGLDPATGEIKKKAGGYYARCQTNRMTERYHIGGRVIVFNDLRKKGRHRFSGARGACREGVVPANGLLYVFPQGCFCGGLETVTRGFLGLAASTTRAEGAETDVRLQKGPAYGMRNKQPAPSSVDWPTFKHDSARSGSTPSAVPTDLKVIWEMKLAERFQGALSKDWESSPSLGDPLTSPVIAGGKIFLALPERHRVISLDERSGKPLWSYTAGGRIDSPPTIHGGLCLFGSHDGWVYCLRAADGKLVWRFRVAPEDRRIMVFGQIESLWPVPGSVLVVDGLAYCVGGRNTAADGGMRVYALQSETGEVVWEKCLKVGKKGVKGVQGLSDVLVSDSQFAYLTATPGVVQFDLKTGEQKFLRRSKWLGKGKGTARMAEPDPQYLVGTQVGILEGTWRRIGSCLRPRKGGSQKSSYGSMNSLMIIFNESWVCGYHVSSGKWKRLDVTGSNFMGKRLVDGKFVTGDRGWSLRVPRPGQFEAVLLSGNTIFAAGPVNGITPKDGTLWAVSADKGKVLMKHPLPAPPVYHGIAAARGRLYIAMQDGKLLCLGKE